jgi:hypothetical protein
MKLWVPTAAWINEIRKSEQASIEKSPSDKEILLWIKNTIYSF